MDTTQCDPSHDHTTLDHQALLSTAQIATRHCIDEVSRYLAGLNNRLLKSDITGIHLNAHWLAQEARQLDVSAEVLATLMGSLSRQELDITNKPNVE